MRAKANLEVHFGSAESAKSAASALASETGFRRARLALKQEQNKLLVTVDADDVVAFRAAANGLLRNLQVFESIEENIE